MISMIMSRDVYLRHAGRFWTRFNWQGAGRRSNTAAPGIGCGLVDSDLAGVPGATVYSGGADEPGASVVVTFTDPASSMSRERGAGDDYPRA